MKEETNPLGHLVAIYALLDPRSDRVRYIGQSVNPRARLRQHASKPHQDDIDGWVNELLTCGMKPRIKVLAWTSAEAATTIEALCILAFGPDNLLNRNHLPILPIEPEKICSQIVEVVSREGRYVPPARLSAIASRFCKGLTQRQVSDMVGIPQSRVSEALNNRNVGAAISIIEHFAPNQVEGPFFHIPEALDKACGIEVRYLPS